MYQLQISIVSRHAHFNQQTQCNRGCSTNTFLIHWFIYSSSASQTSQHHYTQIVKARKVTFWENVNPPSHVTCYVLYVMSHMSFVTCHIPCVKCHMSHVMCKYFIFFRQSGGTYWWRACYQQGLVLCQI